MANWFFYYKILTFETEGKNENLLKLSWRIRKSKREMRKE